MDRRGAWRLKPQVADTLQRDIGAIIAQTGWSRAIDRGAQDHTSLRFDAGLQIGATSNSASSEKHPGDDRQQLGTAGGNIGMSSSDSTSMSESASAKLDIVNYQVRSSLTAAGQKAAHARDPAQTFTEHLSNEIMGSDGLRIKYLRDAAAGRSTIDALSPLTSREQEALLQTGRSLLDSSSGIGDGQRPD